MFCCILMDVLCIVVDHVILKQRVYIIYMPGFLLCIWKSYMWTLPSTCVHVCMSVCMYVRVCIRM